MKPERIIYEKYKDIFDFIDEIITSCPNDFKGIKADSLAKQITLFHYARASYLIDAINRLCMAGYATEAMVILRSLFNLYINIKWLTSEDQNYRMERYADFEIIFKKQIKNNIIEHTSIPIENISGSNISLDEVYDRIKFKYNLKTVRGFHNWSGKSIYQMAKDIGLEKAYLILYGKLSEIEHTGPASAHEYFDYSKKGTIVLKTGPRAKNIDFVLLTSIRYFYDVKEITYSVFNLKWQSVERDKQIYSDLKDKYWKPKLNKAKSLTNA